MNHQQQAYWNQASYKLKVKSRLLSEIASIVKKHSLGNLILVVDNVTAITISNLLTITQLVKNNVTFIERLQLDRKKLEHHALYFITPNQKNISRLLHDFQDPQHPQYTKAHLLFTTNLNVTLLKQLATKTFLKRLAKNSIKQFYHSVRLVQDNVLTFDIPYMILAYGKDNQDEEISRVKISRKLVEILANVGHLNTVRVYYKKEKNMVSERIASSLITTSKSYLATLLENKSHIITKDATDVTFLIMDRSLDTVTPLLHSFTYQSMLFDLLKITYEGVKDLKDKQFYSYQEIQDQIYEQYRYQHLTKALTELPNKLQDFKKKLDSMKSSTVTVDLQQLNQTMKHLKKHIEIVSTLWNKFKEKNLEKVGELQSSLATGVDENGKQTSSVGLIDAVTKIMHESFLTNEERLRLGLLLLCCVKMSKSDYQTVERLYSDDDKKSLKNLIALGVSYSDSINKSTKAISKQQQNYALKRLKQKGMSLDRYSTIVQLILPMVISVLNNTSIQKNLDSSLFGSMECSPFKIQQPRFDKKKFVFYMCGGLSYAQICSLKTTKQTKDIILASDELLSPATYVNNLKMIDIFS